MNEKNMKLLNASAPIIVVLLISIVLILLLKLFILSKKIKYVDEANMWHKLALTDDLTGIYNRNAYNLTLDKNKRSIKKRITGIILFDIDDFKIINDTKGHMAGDIVLKRVARVLLDVFPEPEYRVFRIGGDEFSVLSESASEEEIIRCLIALKNNLSFENISLSKGYSMVKDNIEESFKCADDMLYADKESRKMKCSYE